MSNRINNYQQAIQALNLSSGASMEEVKQRYRALAKQYHPDVYQLDQGERFKEVNAAYRYLKRNPYPTAVQSSSTATTHRKRRAPGTRYRARRPHYSNNRSKERKQQQKEVNEWIIRKVKPVVLLIFFFNFLLTLDYIMPYNEEELTVLGYRSYSTTSSVFSSEPSYRYGISLSSGFRAEMVSTQKLVAQREASCTLSKTLIFGISRKVTIDSTGAVLRMTYGVYNVFGVIIPFIFLLQFLFFYRVKNNDLRMALVGFMIIGVMMQLALTFA